MSALIDQIVSSVWSVASCGKHNAITDREVEKGRIVRPRDTIYTIVINTNT